MQMRRRWEEGKDAQEDGRMGSSMCSQYLAREGIFYCEGEQVTPLLEEDVLWVSRMGGREGVMRGRRGDEVEV